MTGTGTLAGNKYGRYYMDAGKMVAPVWWRHLLNRSKITPPCGGVRVLISTVTPSGE